MAVLKGEPGDYDTHFNAANFCFTNGIFDAAIIQFKKALRLNPQAHAAHCNFGVCLVYMGRLDEGEASLRSSLAIKPDYTHALQNLGLCLKKMGRTTEAIACYNAALEKGSDFRDDAYYQLAVLHKKKGDTVKAREYAQLYDEAAEESDLTGRPLLLGPPQNLWAFINASDGGAEPGQSSAFAM